MTYSFVLLLASYMIIKYLIIGKRYNIAYLSAFYSLTVALAISKLCFFTVVFRYTKDEVYKDYILDISNGVCPQFKMLIGLIQVAIMVELGIQVKLSARRMTPYEADKKIKHVRLALKLAVAFFSALGVCEVYSAIYVDLKIVPDPKRWHTVAHTTIFPCELALISIALTAAYFYLSVNI